VRLDEERERKRGEEEERRTLEMLRQAVGPVRTSRFPPALATTQRWLNPTNDHPQHVSSHSPTPVFASRASHRRRFLCYDCEFLIFAICVARRGSQPAPALSRKPPLAPVARPSSSRVIR
jgi:hypothetical protein